MPVNPPIHIGLLPCFTRPRTKTNSRRRAPARQRVLHTDGGTGMLVWCGTVARRGGSLLSAAAEIKRRVDKRGPREPRFRAHTPLLTGGLQAYSGNFSMVSVSRSFLFCMLQHLVKTFSCIVKSNNNLLVTNVK